MQPVETETSNQENEDQIGLGQNTRVKENTNEFAMVTETGQITIPTLQLPDDKDELLDGRSSSEGHGKSTTFNKKDDDNYSAVVVASRESESLTIGTFTDIVTNCNDKPNQLMLPEFPSKIIGNETFSRNSSPCATSYIPGYIMKVIRISVSVFHAESLTMILLLCLKIGKSQEKLRNTLIQKNTLHQLPSGHCLKSVT